MIAAIGITNQRETTLLWDRATGRPIANAIVWQCRRTAEASDALKKAGHEPRVHEKTGLVLDAYFSATKIARFRPCAPGPRPREPGELALGDDRQLSHPTPDWRCCPRDLMTNGSLTLLMDLVRAQWDPSSRSSMCLKGFFPRIVGNAEEVGRTQSAGFAD